MAIAVTVTLHLCLHIHPSRLQEEVEEARRRQQEAAEALVQASSTPQHHHVAEAEDEGENDEELANGELGKRGSCSSEEEPALPLTANGKLLSSALRPPTMHGTAFLVAMVLHTHPLCETCLPHFANGPDIMFRFLRHLLPAK